MTKKRNHMIKAGVMVFTIAMLLLTFSSFTVAASKKPIVFGDNSWDSVQVHNRIAGFIIKHGYGYSVDYIAVNTAPLMLGLSKGDIDVYMESWTQNMQETYDKMINDGTMLDLGPNFPDSWQGWLVPTYMIKGDSARGIKATAPDLKSVFDLPKYWKLFKDPEDPNKGRFHNSITGWQCTKHNSMKLKAYGLDKYFNDFMPGSDPALSGSMAAAYKKGQTWVGYYWSPTWVLGLYDMTPLEEPPYDPKVWKTTKGCEFGPFDVNVLVNSGFQKKAPEVFGFLKKYETTTAQNNKFLSHMKESKGSTQDAAIWFLEKYESTWTKWVSPEVSKKVKAALP